MKLTYDPKLNVAYLRFKRKTGRVRTICVSEQLNVDLAPDGSVYGVELLNARAQLGSGGKKKLIVQNGESGQTMELSLSA